MSRRSQRRWLRRLALGAGAVLLIAVGVYAWAWSSTGSSTVARALIWMESDPALVGTAVDYVLRASLRENAWDGTVATAGAASSMRNRGSQVELGRL